MMNESASEPGATQSASLSSPAASRADSGDRVDVFLSYSTADTDTAEELAEKLRTSGISTFFGGRSVHGGTHYAGAITRAVARCEIVVVLLSSSSISSPHVQREVSLAIDERRTLLPLALSGVTYPGDFSHDWIYWLGPVNVTEYAGADATLGQVKELRRRTNHHTPPEHRHQTKQIRRRVGAGLDNGHPSPTTLLRPEARLPQLTGFDDELTRLHEWCLRPDDFSARVVTGRAGQGKSRLAQELSRGLVAMGWSVETMGADASALRTATDLPDNPHLLIVDYAEARVEQLSALVTELALHGVPNSLRLLLLARSAGDWWRTLLVGAPEVGDLLTDATVQPLPGLTEDRNLVEDLYGQAHRGYQVALSMKDRVGPVGAPYKTYESVLEVLEDALLSVLEESRTPTPGTVRLLAHERRYLQAASITAGVADLDDMELERIAATLTLYGAETEDEAILLIESCCPETSKATLRRLARLFRRLYPGRSAYIVGLRPDRLAEDLVAAVAADVGGLPGFEKGLSSPDLTGIQRHRALALLARGAARHAALATELRSALTSADDALLTGAIAVAAQVEDPTSIVSALDVAVDSRHVDDLGSMLAAMPQDTVALANTAATIARRLLDATPNTKSGVGDPYTAMRCSNFFSDAGWPAEAATAARQAADMLAGSADETAYGHALTNLSNRLWELGRLEESLAPAELAVDILTSAGAKPFELAAASNNVAFRLAERGRLEDALRHASRTHEICRHDSPNPSVELGKTYGSALNNLACIMLASGMAQQALEHGLAGVNLRRAQAVRNRDQFLVFLARSMANAAPAAEACGQHSTADRLIAEARRLHELTASRAPIFQFEQAESTVIDALIRLGRSDWDSANALADLAQHQLAGVDSDIGALRPRLAESIETITRRAVDRTHVSLDTVAAGKAPGLRLPMLLEYRDL